MTVEERQLRAWIRHVLRHAAIRWARNQGRQQPLDTISMGLKEGFVWDMHCAVGLEDTLWMDDCLPRLRPRDQTILQAIAQGWRPVDIARRVGCDVSTVRRAIGRIRRMCPLSDA